MTKPQSTRRNICVFADVSMNVIDGSSIWLQSICLALANMSDLHIHIILREPISRELLLEPLRSSQNISIIGQSEISAEGENEPLRQSLDPQSLIRRIEELEETHPLVGILVRGDKFAKAIADHDTLSSRLWAYLLYRAPLIGDIDQSTEHICRSARFIIAQSEAQRALLEARIPEANSKVIVSPPMLPSSANIPAEAKDPPGENKVILAYAGKYSKLWNVESYFDLPEAARAGQQSIELLLIGDKVHTEPSDVGFYERMHQKLQYTDGVNWLQGLSREKTYEKMAEANFGLCWRSDSINDSIEVSTKFLEFASLGVPVFLNRTQNYELALGEDYPFFTASIEDIIYACQELKNNPDMYRMASERCLNFAQSFTLEKATKRLRRLLDLSPPAPTAKKTTVAIASHEFKFVKAICAHLEQDPSLSVVIDTWKGQGSHRIDRTRCVLARSDVIFCEWCCGNAVWYSENKLPGQVLVVRLHRFEYFTDYPRQVNIENVDAVIVVSEHFKRCLISDLGWPSDKIFVEAQYVDASYLDRKKHSHADTTLGFVGIVAYNHKRFDRAVDILEAVQQQKPEMKLRVRSRMPWEFPWAWSADREARQAYQRLFMRIRSDQNLRDSIIFDNAGADMAEWYRNVGYMLSTSETEGCHTSIAEGMASGAIPILINWEGVESVYPQKYIFDGTDTMAGEILVYANDEQLRHETRNRMRMLGAEGFDIARTLKLYRSFIDRAKRQTDAKKR